MISIRGCKKQPIISILFQLAIQSVLFLINHVYHQLIVIGNDVRTSSNQHESIFMRQTTVKLEDHHDCQLQRKTKCIVL